MTSVAWLAPEYRFWGRSKLFDEFYFSLQKELPQTKKKKANFAEEVKIPAPDPVAMRSLQSVFWSPQEKSLHFHEGELANGRIDPIGAVVFRLRCFSNYAGGKHGIAGSVRFHDHRPAID